MKGIAKKNHGKRDKSEEIELRKRNGERSASVLEDICCSSPAESGRDNQSICGARVFYGALLLSEEPRWEESRRAFARSPDYICARTALSEFSEWTNVVKA